MSVPTQQLRDADFKDAAPLKTVEHIRKILQENGIEVREQWFESGVPYCYSIRVSVKGTTFGVNGKGLTPEFTLASGYGELMERLQLGYLGSDEVQKDGSFSVNSTQEEAVSVRTLLERNRKWYTAMGEGLRLYTGKELTPEQILTQYADGAGNVAATPYYCVTTGTKEYLPTALRKAVYTANGCAAGNTMEEAIVQAMSEIVERKHQIRLISENITPPDVPEAVLQRCQAAYSIISYVRSKGFRVIIKDCSLGMRFPVVCACFIQESTGRYHTHFGAYPVFEIALERALTESFQGRNLENIRTYGDFCYDKVEVFTLKNLMNELTKGSSAKMPGFFAGEPSYAYNEAMGFTGENNQALLRQCTAFFAEQGWDILVRDCSCLGFPTYQVLIPGYSEVFSHRLSAQHNDRRYGAYAVKALRDPVAATQEDKLGLLMHLAQTARMSGNISGVHGFLAGARLSAELEPEQEARLMAAALGYVYYELGKYKEVPKYIDRLLGGSGEEYLLCVKRYLALRSSGTESGEIRQVLSVFHRPETVAALYACLEEKRNPLADYVLRCDRQCKPDCRLHPYCRKKNVSAIAKLINEKTAGLCFDTFAESLRRATAN